MSEKLERKYGRELGIWFVFFFFFVIYIAVFVVP